MNLFEVFERQATVSPYAPAFVTPSQSIGYAEAVERAQRIAAALAAKGVHAGERVAVRLHNSPLHLLAMLALARLGAVAVPLHPRRPAEDAAKLALRLGISADLHMPGASSVEGTRGIAMDDTIQAPAATTWHAMPKPPGGDAPLLLALTSGTTGHSKAITWSHALLIRHWERMQRLSPHGPGVRLLIFMGLDAHYALQSALRMLLSGGAVLLTPNVAPASLFDAVERLGANTVLSSAAVLAGAMEGLSDDVPRLPTVTRLRVGGSLISPTLLSRLRRRLTPHVEITYGSTETGMTASGYGATLDRAPFSVGTLAPWVELRIVDDDGIDLPQGQQGQLQFRSDAFPSAYVDDVGASAWIDGWYRTGDVGRLLAGGILVLGGRADEIINLGGTKIQPAETEGVLLEVPTILEAAVFAVPGPEGTPRLLAAVVVGEGYDEQAALSHCRARLGQRAPYRLLRVRQLPRNAAGKVLRHELAARTRISASPPSP